MAAPQVLEMLADDLAKKEQQLVGYIESSCQGDDPSKVFARTIANGRLAQIRLDRVLVDHYRSAVA